MYPYEDNMTQDMLDCLLDEDELKEEFKMCYRKYKETKAKAWIELPATAASGDPVVHGARMVVNTIVNYWKDRMNAAGMILTYNTVIELQREVDDASE